MHQLTRTQFSRALNSVAYKLLNPKVKAALFLAGKLIPDALLLTEFAVKLSGQPSLHA